MNNPDQNRIDALFLKALELAPPERDTFLDSECGGSDELRIEIDELLAAYEDADAVLPPTPTIQAIPPGEESLDDLSGRTIDHYTIKRLIATGGMGEVYEALQENPQRPVALKVIKLGMDTRQVIARFKRERQALALMDHPNVAKVFDAGVTPPELGGRPYFVMEYVAGTPLTEHCDLQRLSLDDRLAIFMQVCAAVQHAHQKGVIHRDLKPSNILVDGSGNPRVIDFGVARATNQNLTEQTLFTQQGQLIGTPEYMSPEQAEMTAEDIDTRSDIYSLGVILYELLTGALPFEPSTLRHHAFAEIQRIIREEDPPKPSTRLSSMDDRVPSPLPGAGGGLGRGFREEDDSGSFKGISGGSAAVFAQNRRLDLRSLSRQLRGDLDWIVMKCLEKDRNRRYETANGLANDLKRHLNHQPVTASPPSAAYRLSKFIRRNRIGVIAGGVVASALVVATLVSILFAFSEAKQRRIAITARDAEREAKQQTQSALELAEQREREARRQTEVAQAVNDFLNDDLLGVVAPSAKSGKGRSVLMREVLDIASEKIEEQSLPGGRFADKPLIEASIRSILGQTFVLLGEYSKAEPHLKRTHDLLLREKGEEHVNTLNSKHNLAFLYHQQGRYDEAEALYLQLLETNKHIHGPEHLDSPDTLSNLANVYSDQGHYDQAEAIHLQVLEARKRTLGSEHTDTLNTLSNLASLYLRQGHYDQAEPLLVETLEIRKRILGPEDPDTLSTMSNLAVLYQNQGRYNDLEPLFLEILEIRQRISGPEHSDTLGSMNNLALLYKKQKRYDQAEPLFLQTLEILKRVFDPEHPRTLAVMNNLANLYSETGQYDKAEPLYLQTLEIEKRIHGLEHQSTLGYMTNLGQLYLKLNRLDDAEDILTRSLALKRRLLSIDHPFTRTCIATLVRLYKKQGRTEEASTLRRELTLWTITHIQNRSQKPDATANELNNYAWFLLTSDPPDLQDPPAALALALRACELTNHKNPGNLDTLALAYHLTGENTKAVETANQALELLPPDAPGRSDYEAALTRYQKALDPQNP